MLWSWWDFCSLRSQARRSQSGGIMDALASQPSVRAPRRSVLVVAAQLLLVVAGLVGLALFAFAEALLAWPVEWWLYLNQH